MVIIAERSTFAKVISSVWNEAVDEAAYLGALELREIDPGVIAALCEAAFTLARSRIMDELIDQCITDLTGPEGELWPDARAMAAVADGLGYQVRCEVMSELINAAVAELADSGEAELLMSEAAAARSRTQESGRDGDTDENTWWAAAGGALADPGSGAGHETQGEVSSASVLVGVAEAHQLEGSRKDGVEHVHNQEERQSDEEWGLNGRGAMTETEAAVLVQSVLRRKAVYRDTKALVARNFVRLYDPSHGAFYW